MTRDPARIERILARVRSIWTKNPDLRLLQLLLNMAPADVPTVALYAVEDDKLEEWLKAYDEV